MITSRDIDSRSLELTAAGFGALADPIRLEILARLGDGAEHCVCELLPGSEVAPNLLSYHLGVLRRAGLIAARKRGRWVDYRLVPEALARLLAALPAGPQPERASRRRRAAPGRSGRETS